MSTDKLVTKSDLQEFYNRILPYLGGSAEAGFTPVGTVISVMGKTAPTNYLACDGSVYNIADYPELANYFLQQFESKNYFGGDGTTTFAVPDLQGEFLRGAGTNSHTNQGSGAEVGTHQDGTLHLDVHIGSDGKIIYSGRINNTNTGATQIDYQSAQVNLRGSCASSSVSTATSNPYYTSRPTNTSVLFCIATKNIYLNPSLDFSTSEKVVGTYIDGKPLYQKTIVGNIPITQTEGTDATTALDVSQNVDTFCYQDALIAVDRTGGDAIYFGEYGNMGSDNFRSVTYAVDSSNVLHVTLHNKYKTWSGKMIVTVRYTKTSD